MDEISDDKVEIGKGITAQRRPGRPCLPTINLTDKQKPIFKSDKRFVFVCAGRRFGKTTVSRALLYKIAMEKEKLVIWYVAPTYKKAKELMWDQLLSMIRTKDLYKISKTQSMIWLRNGSKIFLKGSDRADHLRGEGLDYVVMEEYSFHKRGVWDLIIRPQLADRKGKALFIGTPSMKFGSHYRLLHDIAKSGKDKDWDYFHFTIYDNPFIAPDEIEAIKKSVPQYAWTQEYMAEFVDEEGPVYFEFDPIKNVYTSEAEHIGIEKTSCYRGMDWGMDDDTACVWGHVLDDGRIVISQEHSQNNWTASRQAKAICDKSADYSQIKNTVIDCTSFKRDGSGDSNANMLRRNGITPLIPSDDGSPTIGIDVVKQFLRGDDRGPWLLISDKCRSLISSIQEWQHGRHEPDVASALRYLLVFMRNRNMTPLMNRFNEFKNEVKVKAPAKPVPYVHRISMEPTKAVGFTWDYDSGGWA